MKIIVTEDDILSGKAFSCSACPIAKAIHRTMGSDEPSVGAMEVWFPYDYDSRKRKFISLPETAKQFISQFDGRKKNDPYPLPFEFELPDIQEEVK